MKLRTTARSHAAAALLLALAWIIFLYRDTMVAMVSIWYRSETFTHGFLVLPISLWLVWRRRQWLAAAPLRPSFGVLPVIAGAALLWFLGALVAVNAVTQLAFVALIVLSVPAVLGRSAASTIVFPLGFLFFAVPIGEFLLPQLMAWTADFTVFALRMSGVPVYREGLSFVIPSGSWSVVEACSGVRYLIASLTVGTLFAYLNYQSLKRRLLFAGVSIVVPIIANWLRAYMIVMLGHLSGNKLAVGVDHLIYGWVFFGVVIMLMFIIGSRWSEPESMNVPSGAEPAQVHEAASITGIWMVALGLAVLVSLPHFALSTLERRVTTAAIQLELPDKLAQGWRADDSDGLNFEPAFQNPSAQVNRRYAAQNGTVGLYVGYYRDQHDGHEMVSSGNVLVTSKDPWWTQLSNGSRLITLAGEQVTVRAVQLHQNTLAGRSADGPLVAWQLYWLNGRVTASDYAAKVYGAMDRVMGHGDKSAVIVVYALKDQTQDSEALLQNFLSANYEIINDLLVGVK